MKKVVLLTGALAAGLASAGLNANASVPVAPNVQETNASDQQVAEMKYETYHGIVSRAFSGLYDLKTEFEKADIDNDAKTEILADIEKRRLELSSNIEDLEKAYDAYQPYRDDAAELPAKLAALQTELGKFEALIEAGTVVLPNEAQIKENLRDRYYHVAKDWKIYKDNVTRGFKLLAAFQDLMDDQYKQIDEIEDVKAAKKAVEDAHEDFRLDNEKYHADRWYLDDANNWGPVADDHTTKACCVDKEADLETLYQTLETKKGDFDTLLNKYYTAKETLTSKLDTSNQAETAELTADPDTYTKSVDGKAWVKAAQQKVNDAQKAADDFIKTYNAANPAVWSNPASVDQLKGEDGKAPTFKEESEYERRANELITAVDNAIKDLDAAVKEAKANEKAYQDGLTALKDRQNELDDIKTAYADKNKEFTTGKVYEQVIKAEQDKIDKATTDLTKAWNTWTDKTLVPVDPKNAVEHVAGVTVDGVIYAQLKQDIADLLTKIQKNEAANDKIHQMTEALNGHYNELKNAVADYEDVALSQYAADGLCAHGEYLGTTSLDNLLKKFIEDEQKKYDEIQSDAYLADTTENGPTAKKEALDHELEMTWNAIATDQCAKYLAKVEAEYNTKHSYCEGLDDVCNEVEGEGAPCTCSEDDREANPCGWCDATARGMHDAIETAKSEMDGKIQDWHFATDAKNHVAEVKTYKDDAFTAIENWVKTFEEADRLHDKNLDDLKVIVDKAVHNVHDVYADARHDRDNFTDADLAAANLWAQNKYGVDFKGYIQLLEELYETAQVAADDARAKHHYTELKAVGTECDTYATESDYMNKVEANKDAFMSEVTLIEGLASILASIEVGEEELYGDATNNEYTGSEAEHLVNYKNFVTALENIGGLIENFLKEASEKHINGVADEYLVDTTENGFQFKGGAISAAIEALKADLAAAKKLYAENKAKAAELTETVNNLVDVVRATVPGDVYEDDLEALSDANAELMDDLYDEIAAIADEFAAGTVLTNEATIAAAIGELSKAVFEYQSKVKTAESVYAANVTARTVLYGELKDAETLLASIMVDAHTVYGDDFTALDNMVQAIRDLIDAEPANIEKAFDEKVATEYVINGEIGSKIINLQTAVKDYEEFLRDNRAKAVELTGELNDLLVILDGMHKYGDVYPEDKLIIDYLLDNDNYFNEVPEGVMAAVLGLVERVKAELANVDQDLTDGLVQANYENYKDAIEYFKADIEELKATIEYAEMLWAANYRALNNLEEMIMAEKTVLENTKAMCACNECNVEDQAEVTALLTQLDTILGEVNDSFSETKDLAMQEGAFKAKVDEVKADAANLLALIQLHLDTAQNDLRVYNTLQALLANTVDAEMLNLEAEEGYKCFANRDAYHNEDYNPERPHFHDGATTNPNVKYGNELTKMVEDLKAEIERQHSHEGGHSCEENKIADVKAMNNIKAEIEKTIAAIKANEAAHELLKDRFAELFEDAKDAYNFWHQYYSTATLITHEGDIANWISEWNGELENGYVLAALENTLHDDYVHGNAANAWTVDGKGEELNDAANDKFAEKDADLANDRNELAHTEAVNHAAQVTLVVNTYVNNTKADYTAVDAEGFTIDDPFVKEVLVDWKNDVEGEFGLIDSLNYYKKQIEDAYEEKVMEDAINIDNHNTALGIHQQLDGILGVLSQIEADYAKLFEDAHHLTNGKTLYSDMQYVTIGFFRKANEGLGEQATEMFKVVEPHFVAEEGNIAIYDLNWLETTPVDPTRGVDEADAADVELPEYAKDLLLPVRDENDYLVHQEGCGVIPAEVGVLGHGDKKNELTFTLNDEKDREVVTLAAGPADITFKPGSLTVHDEYNNEWLTKHNVYIEINVEAPQVEVEEADVTGSSNKLIVRLNAPIDLTYTINSLVAKTDKGEEFSYADRVINYAANTLEFDLPAGTESVELPEGFFTFRTGENSIARSAAMVVAVGGIQTSIDAIIAMGEKAEIFDLQGRRVKAESLLSGNAYVVNGQKVVVK